MKTPEADGSDNRALIAVGKIVKAHGVRGEVKVFPLTNLSGRFESLTTVILERKDGVRIETEINSIRGSADNIIASFTAIETREQADEIRGAFISVRREDMPTLDSDQYYTIDLVGMSVRDEQGTDLGTIEEVIEYPASAALVIRSATGVIEMPAVRDFIITVDMDEKTVTVRSGGIPDNRAGR